MLLSSVCDYRKKGELLHTSGTVLELPLFPLVRTASCVACLTFKEGCTLKWFDYSGFDNAAKVLWKKTASYCSEAK